MDAEIVLTIAELTSADAYIRVTDGDEAIGLLDKGGFDLILLDLNLPRRHGIEVLRAVRAHPTQACTPVVVFSSSYADTDITGAMKAGASAYVVKPSDASGLRAFVSGLHAFWTHHRVR